MCVYLFIFVTSIFGESVDLKWNLRFQDIATLLFKRIMLGTALNTSVCLAACVVWLKITNKNDENQCMQNYARYSYVVIASYVGT